MSSSVVGLDLGNSGIRAVQVSTRKGKVTVEKIGFVALERGIIENGEIRDPARLTDALKNLWAKHKFVKQVAFGLSNGEVLVRMINLAWMPPADFRKALPYQVAEYLSAPVDQMYLDYHQVSETVTNDDGKEQRWNTILFVAAKRNMVEAFVDALQAAGLMPIKANITPFALIAAAPHTDLNPETAEAVIDLGADMINVVCHQGGQPVYVRTIPGAGGNNVTRDLAQHFGWDWSAAEERKISLGLSTTVTTEASTDQSVFGGTSTAGTHIAQESPEQVLINQRMGMLVAEVRSTLDFFLNSNQGVGSLTKITLTGGGAGMHGLAARLSGEMRIPVGAVQPFEGLTLRKGAAVDGDMPEYRLAVAVGLGMGAV
ncbi:type IV pilus assembly protein PilM [Tessaracoccus sp.]